MDVHWEKVCVHQGAGVRRHPELCPPRYVRNYKVIGREIEQERGTQEWGCDSQQVVKESAT